MIKWVLVKIARPARLLHDLGEELLGVECDIPMQIMYAS
jgi:hypothetical protein